MRNFESDSRIGELNGASDRHLFHCLSDHNGRLAVRDDPSDE
ncbi:hypothetical protein B1M_37476 [Burkholderia sp. TJI49]|nr:hypothetical protein B1M_37476 [Burkholderia sp. TJI49]